MSETVVHPTPAPGSARAKVAEFAAAAASVPMAAGPVAPDMTPVPVTGTTRAANADEGTARTLTLDANNPWAQILPQDSQRHRAVLVASSAEVYLCQSREMAQEVAINGSTSAGGSLPANYPVPLTAKCVWYAANATPASKATLTVIVERYAAEG